MNRSATVLHIIPNLRTGGAELMLVRLLSERRKYPGFEHVVLLLGHGNDFSSELNECGVHVHSLHMGSYFSIPCRLYQLRREVKKLQPDLIHAWMYHANMAAIYAKTGCPVLFSVHNTLDALAHEKWTTRLVLKHGAKLSHKANAIVYCSEKGKMQHEQFGYHAGRSIFIPNGVNTDVFKPDPLARKQLREMLGLNQQTILFGQIARFHPIKNQTGLVRSFGDLTNRSPDAELLLAGEGCDHDNKILTDLITHLGIRERVHLMGLRHDVERILPGLDFLVSPSLSEAFPVVVAEAMACGLPCIVTDVGDSAALVGHTGVVVPQNDTIALTNALQEMSELPERGRADLGLKARTLIRRKYSMDVIAETYHSLYLSLLRN